MLSVLQSDRIGPLAGHLLDRMERAPLAPLEAETVVIGQNRGLRAWLTGALAERTGCAASVETPSPRALCLRLARALVPGASGSSNTAATREDARDPFHRASLAWRVAAFLEDLPAGERYAPLRAYLAGGPERDDRRLPLARRIADRFGDYQVYRPRLLADWAAGERRHPDHPHAAWQAPLWRRLTEQADRPSRARRLLALEEKLRTEPASAKRLPQRVAVFGAGLFPPLYLDVLAALGRHVPVRVYLVVGKDGGEYGSEDEAKGNRVLPVRLNRQRRAFCDLLGARCEDDGWTRLGSGHAAGPTGSNAKEPAQTALRAVQAGGPRDAPVALRAGDRSLRVHSCHSRRRELEVLRDQLFDAFDAIPELTPGDVLVAAPGLEAYAPLIQTVFEAESSAGAKVPVHVASAKHGPECRALRAAGALLALPGSRCTAPEVMELLDYPVLRRAAGIAPEEVPAARRWVRKAGIRWGRDAAHRAAFAEGETSNAPENGNAAEDGDAGTWKAGMERLLLGHVAGPTEEAVCGRRPCAEANADRAALLGRLAAWLRRLFSFAEDAETPRPLAAWSTRLAALFDDLLAPETRAEHDAVQHLAETAQELEHVATLASAGAGKDNAPPRVAFAAVREHLDDAIHAYEAHAETVTGRVTFAAPMTLRFAPHRVVAFLGLGDAFPAVQPHPADDLIGADPRPGDHDAEREGGQLFYDALHAATDRLILTFVGRSDRGGAERAPSAVLEALLETCEATFAVEAPGPAQNGHAEASEGAPSVRERLVAEHPLQPFHPDYFAPGGPLFSYDRAHLRGHGERRPAPRFFDGPLPEDDASDTDATVQLADLQRAWAHPTRFFCTRVLGLRLDGEDALDDRQPVSPGALAAYRARQEALRQALRDGDPGASAARLAAEGALPPGRQGRAWFERQRAEAEAVARAVEAQGARRPRTLRAEGGSDDRSGGARWAVAGRLDHVAEGGALAFRCATPKAKDFARAWPAHLLLCAAGAAEDPRETRVIGSRGEAWRFRPLEAGPAQKLLYRLVRGYRAIRRAPRPFFPASSLACVEARSDFYAKKKARNAFYDGYRPGEESDPYVALCFRGRDPLSDDAFDLFRKWAAAFFDPLLQFRAKG